MKASSQLDINKVKEAIEIAKQRIGTINQDGQAVLIIGGTGVGKTTLAMLLHGFKLQSHDPTGMNKKIISPSSAFQQHIPQEIFIEHKAQSGTSIPFCLRDQSQNIYYWDTPGFGDNRGATQDLINGYYIKKIFETHRYVKILFVTSHTALTEDRSKLFLTVVENLTQSLDVIDGYTSSLGMVVTCAEHGTTVDHIRQTVVYKILSSKDLAISQHAKKLCEYIVQSGNIAIMERPTQDSYDVENWYVPLKHAIINMICNNLQHISTPNIRIIIDEQSQKVVESFASKMVEPEIENSVNKYLQDVEKHIKNMFGCFNNIVPQNTRADNCQLLLSYIQNIKNCDDLVKYLTNNSEMYYNLCNKTTSCGVQSGNAEDLKDHVATYMYLSTVTKINSQTWYYIVDNCIKSYVGKLNNALDKGKSSEFVKLMDCANYLYSENIGMVQGILQKDQQIAQLRNEAMQIINAKDQEIVQLKAELSQHQQAQNQSNETYCVSQIVYNNKILNDKKLLKYLTDHAMLAQVLNLGEKLSDDLVEDSTATQNYELALAGLISLGLYNE